jgi:hypothetical protein
MGLPAKHRNDKERMREALLGKLVMVLSRATPEELAAIYCFATGEPLGSAECRMQKGGHGGRHRRDYAFRFTGRDWKVVFGGG